MDQQSVSEEQAIREAHVNKLVSRAALARLNRLVDDAENEEKLKRRVVRGCVIGIAALFTLVMAAKLVDAAILAAVARCVTSVFR